MKTEASDVPPAFDGFANEYEAALGQGLKLSGEDSTFFAKARVDWTKRRLADADAAGVRRILDFGCGTGGSVPFLLEAFPNATLVGVDPSRESLARLLDRFGGERVSVATPEEFVGVGSIDLAFTNGVFHHIPPAERSAAMSLVVRALRPGGHFALWENNPWNPGTRLVMSRIPFDRDAICLSPPEARRMSRAVGLSVSESTFQFIFPRSLRALRPIEPLVSRLPIGGQFLTLCRKPR